jgi:hypothetical protein
MANSKDHARHVFNLIIWNSLIPLNHLAVDSTQVSQRLSMGNGPGLTQPRKLQGRKLITN